MTLAEPAGAGAIEIREDDLAGPEIAALLATHRAFTVATSPACSVHSLPLEGLRAPDVTVWTAWEAGALLGCAALKALDAEHGEVKSMHTAEAHRGRGVAARLLAHLLAEARRRGYRRLSLETGSMAAFAPARALYERAGFVPTAPFGTYREDPHSAFYTLAVD